MTEQTDFNAGRQGRSPDAQRGTAPQVMFLKAAPQAAAPVPEAEDDYEGVAVLGYN
jgi:hypothetical protein